MYINILPIELSITRGSFWIRVFGKGISIINRKVTPELFSSRLGKRKIIRIKQYTIEYLR